MPVTEYFTAMVRPLLKFPDSLKVVQTLDELGVLLTVDVHKEDMGIIIGRAGETAKALRLIMRIFGVTHKAKVSVKIQEPEGSLYKLK